MNNSLTNEDYILNDNTTSKGISIGSSSNDFIQAYKDNDYLSIIYWDSNSNAYQSIKMNDIDFSKQSFICLESMFVDDKAINIDSFKKKNKIEDNLDTWFTENTDYLKKHSVVYKCLIFSFQNEKVTDIQYYEKNYND
jgi:hypothetical protein